MSTVSGTVFMLFLIFRSVALQAKDDFTCHCKDSDCQPTPTPCPSGCAPGWEGPFCQNQNLAYRKSATQSGVYTETTGCTPENKALNPYCRPLGAQLAVDGNDDTDYWHGSCAVTDTNSQSAWWKVDLQQEYNISGLLIYQRNHIILSPLYIEVLVDNQTCYNVTGNEVKDVIIDITCHQSLSGSAVTLRTSVSSKANIPSLTLCEVKIFQCSDFWFGSQCKHRCHCHDTQEVCHKTTGACASGCATGWRGNSCQEYNIALHKPAFQAGTWTDPDGCNGSSTNYCGPRFSSFAVDGMRDQNFHHGSCSQTASGRIITSWSLNLGRLYEIHRMKLYLPLNDTNDTSGIQITVNGNLCFNSTRPIPNIADITCHQPLQGIFVSINLPLMNVSGVAVDRVLTLCEVEIYECDDFLFGSNCQDVCRCQNISEVCDKISGHCSKSGCSAGWIGVDCNTACPHHTFGVNCSSQCGRCADNVTCDPATGECQGFCNSGFMAPLCVDCLPGLYGLNCDKTCSGCPYNGSCYRQNGTCVTTCPEPFTGIHCTACHDGWYGPGCQNKCGDCRDDAPCNNVSGHCPNGCDSGWHGSLCKQECPDGQYGADCQQNCSHCIDPVPCDKMTGFCLGECQDGWAGDRCDSCDVNVYSASCNQTCGRCLDTDTCDHLTGRCPGACMTGWTGDYCKTVCPEYTYGVNCSGQCGRCADNVTCDPVTGECPDLCSVGFMAPTCTDCLHFLFGTNCDQICPHCPSGSCYRQNGTCVTNCPPHFTGINCTACHDGWYGAGCQNKCGDCRDDAPCNNVSGYCPNGCDPGWQGPLCKQECPDGQYGAECQQNCSHCLDPVPCDKLTGFCLGECQDGWAGDKCERCNLDMYSANCNESCGHCLDTDTCDKVTGKCPGACMTGWTGDNCQTVMNISIATSTMSTKPSSTCPEYTYGVNCSGQCGRCADNVTCDPVTGECPDLCSVGFMAPTCTECPDGQYGAECQQNCSHCLDPVPCDKLTGFCLGECQDGWAGDRCDRCNLDMYSANCNESCGHCLDTDTCDKVTGKCPGACMTGWTGDNCQTASKQPIATRTSRLVTSPKIQTHTQGTSTILHHYSTTTQTQHGTKSQQGLSQGVIAAIVISSVVIVCISLHSLIYMRYSRRGLCYRGRRSHTCDHIESATDFSYTELPKYGGPVASTDDTPEVTNQACDT